MAGADLDVDWTAYIAISLVALAFALLYVFFAALLKPLGKHLAERLISVPKYKPEVEEKLGAARPEPNQSETDFGRSLVRMVLESFAPIFGRILESNLWTAYGVSAVFAGIIVMIEVWVALVFGLNLAAVGFAAGASIFTAGLVEMWIGKRRLSARQIR